MNATGTRCVNWLFGRGLSICCNLGWEEPREWRGLPRSERIERIKSALREEMDKPEVDRSPIRTYLGILERNTAPGWRYRFVTTNWDGLLQREILSLDLEIKPSWMDNSHVFHPNGSVETGKDDTNRIHFVLEDAPPPVMGIPRSRRTTPSTR